jgi:hypothetical protein
MATAIIAAVAAVAEIVLAQRLAAGAGAWLCSFLSFALHLRRVSQEIDSESNRASKLQRLLLNEQMSVVISAHLARL